MGPASDSMAVVDQRLRVHGIANLWVGDASIMPVVSRANTNLTSIMIGERLADFVQEVACKFKSSTVQKFNRLTAGSRTTSLAPNIECFRSNPIPKSFTLS